MIPFPLLLLIAQTPNLEGAVPSFGWLLIKTLIAMGLIIGLAFVVIRYVFPRFYGGRSPRGAHIKIIERAGLEVRKGLYIVQVGKKIVLLGTSDHKIEKIMDLQPEDLNEHS